MHIKKITGLLLENPWRKAKEEKRKANKKYKKIYSTNNCVTFFYTMSKSR